MTFPFQAYLQVPKGRRCSCVFICIPNIYFSPHQTTVFHSPFEAQVLPTRYTMVLDVCAGTVCVAKTLSMVLSTCLSGTAEHPPFYCRNQRSINHTVNPTGVEEHSKCGSGPRTSSSYQLLDPDNCRFVNFPSYHVVVLQLLVIF